MGFSGPSMDHSTPYLNSAGKGKNPKMRNAIHNSPCSSVAVGLAGRWFPLWSVELSGADPPDSACIVSNEGSPLCYSCSSALPSALRFWPEEAETQIPSDWDSGFRHCSGFDMAGPPAWFLCPISFSKSQFS